METDAESIGATTRTAGTSTKRAKRMDAVVAPRYGSPDVLRFEEVERPAPEDDEV